MLLANLRPSRSVNKEKLRGRKKLEGLDQAYVMLRRILLGRKGSSAFYHTRSHLPPRLKLYLRHHTGLVQASQLFLRPRSFFLINTSAEEFPLAIVGTFPLSEVADSMYERMNTDPLAALYLSLSIKVEQHLR